MIKSNIDLTENEMFSRPSMNRMPSVNLFRTIGAIFPWAVHFHEVKDDYDLSPEYQPVLTGNKEERELKQLFLEENSGNHCDCCGVYLLVIPWDRTYGLCRRCQHDMETNYGNKPKYPWEQQYSQRRGGTNPLYW